MTHPDPLDADRIRAALAAPLDALTVHTQIDSTNAALLREPAPQRGVFAACLADAQTDGIGRRGTRWQSPPGAGLYLSLAWRLAPAADLSSLSLACGVAALDALESLGVHGVQLKWPNDLVHGDAKLGGILVQSRSLGGGEFHVVAGIGVNVHAAPGALGADALPATSIAAVTRASQPQRNALAAALVERFIDAAGRYAAHGFAPFVERWRAADYLRGKRVCVADVSAPCAGIACGVAQDGALEVQTGAGVTRVVSGSVRVQAAAP